MDWPATYLDSQFRLHRAGLNKLAAQFRAGNLPDEPLLPLTMRYLSRTGHARIEGDALFIPVWQNWRAEQGTGFGYFPGRSSPDKLLNTAAGDFGRPTRRLGGGWWWVA